MELLKYSTQFSKYDTTSLIITLICGLVLYYYFTVFGTTCARKINKFPGPPTLPFIGCQWALFVRMSELSKIPKKLTNLFQSYGYTLRFWMGNIPYIFTKDVSIIEKILSNPSCSEKGECYKALHFLMGKGLFTAPMEKWKVDRKILSPGMKSTFYPEFLQSFNKNAETLVEILETKLESGKPRDLYEDFCRCTTQIVLDALIKYPIDLQRDPKSRLFEASLICSKLVQISGFIWAKIPFLWEIFGYSKMQRENMGIIREALLQFDEKMEATISKSSSEKSKNTFLDILYSNYSKEERFFQMTTFIGAGFETTSATLCHTLYLLAVNPHIQKKVHEELDFVYGDSERDTSLEDISQLKYLDLVIKESMRIYSPIGVVGRILEFDIELGNGLVLPKGCTVIIPVADVHMNPETYPQPNKFIPERFSPEQSKERSPYSYIPFSGGPRGCIAQRFAMMELKVILSKILSKFEVRTEKAVGDVEFEYGIVVHAVDGLPVSLKKRSHT